MLKIYEQFFLEYFSKKYSALLSSDKNQGCVWKRLLKIQFPKLQLNTNFGGFNLGDQHLSSLIFELGRWEMPSFEILNKLLFIDTLNLSILEIGNRDLLSNLIINDNLIIYFFDQRGIDDKLLTESYILEGHIATIVSEKTKKPAILGIVTDHKIYYFDLPNSRQIKTIKSKVMGTNTLSLIATSLELRQLKLVLSCQNKNSKLLMERFYRFLYVYILGICSKMLEVLKVRITTRRQFSKKISEFQIVRFNYSRIYADHQILVSQLNYFKEQAGIAKEQLLLSKSHLHNCMKTGMQYFGAYGLLNESNMSAFYQKGSVILTLITQLLGDEQ